eukprot:EG_transcript_14049
MHLFLKSTLLASLFACSYGATQCAKDGSDYSYTETISGQSRLITTTFCPNHPYKNINPNYPVKGSTTFTVPAYPRYDPNSITSLTEQGGITGVTFSGVMIFSPYGGTQYGKVTGYSNSAVAGEGFTFDMCGAHASLTTAASYHHHVPPSCLLRQLGASDSSHSPQIGWASDGFPVYGPRGPSGVLMQTCNVTGGTYGVDVCTNNDGGYFKLLSGVDNFVFRYYTQGPYNNGSSCTNPVSPLPNASYYPSTPTGYYGCCPSGVSCSSSWLSSCNASSPTLVNGTTSAYSASSSVLYPSGLSRNCAACWSAGESGTTPSVCTSSTTTGGGNGAPSLSPSLTAVPLLALILLCSLWL